MFTLTHNEGQQVYGGGLVVLTLVLRAFPSIESQGVRLRPSSSSHPPARSRELDSRSEYHSRRSQ